MNVARRRPELIVWAMMAVFAVVFSYLAVARQRAFWTGRFDLGNMVQAVWSTAQGRPLETTDVGGVQFVRLGAHVDPILVLFTPLAWTGALPEALLVAQVLIVASGALPAYWLGRRWLADTRLAVAAAAVYLLYPPLQWTVVTEFHPVALAAPLLMFCIWAAEERRFMTLTIFAVLAALTKEEVALALAMLGVWMMVRGITRRRYGAFLAAASLAWVAFAVLWIIPHYNAGQGSEFVDRYGSLGSDGGGVLTTLLTRPWEAAEVAGSYDRLSYLGALLLPLLLLPLAAPLLLAGALPELLINILADWFPQYSIEFQYVAVIVPFAVGASILGLARVRRLQRPAPLARFLRHPGRVAAVWVGAVVLAGVYQGPLPWWDNVPLVGSDSRVEQYRVNDHARVMARATDADPRPTCRCRPATSSAPTSPSASGSTPSRCCATRGGRSSTATGPTSPTASPPASTGSGSRRCWPARTGGSSSGRMG